MKRLSNLIILLFLLSFYCQAIVIRHDVDPDMYQVKQTQYPSVVDLNFLTGTLIAPQWVLTASHGTPYMPSNQEIIINQQKYYVQYIIEHPDYNKDDLDHDIALLKLDRPVVNVISTDIYSLADEKGQHVWFVGRGDIGNGRIGITGSTKTLRHAENIIESTDGVWLTFDFDSPKNNALALEGISGPGDSGGPAFVNTPAGLKVAGVSSHQRDNNNGEGLYGVKEYYTRTSAHKQWIASTIDKKDSELSKVALIRPVLSIIEATKKETSELIGRYLLEDEVEFYIEPCAAILCYRWGNSSAQTEIFKTTENRWFTPKINRYFKVYSSDNGMVNSIVLHDFYGERELVKQDQVKGLNSKIKTRNRKLVTHVEPIWPEQAKNANIEGSVTMSFSINNDGSVYNIKVINSTPSGLFDKASIEALSQWKYAELDKPLFDIKTRFDFSL
jgi:TonB family protein